MALDVLELHTSPDGTLTFMVALEAEDVILGFECQGKFGWHTHADLSIGEARGPELRQAARSFVDALQDDKILIAISQADGKKEVWVTDDPVIDLQNRIENEVLEFRFWSGNRMFSGQEILTSGAEWMVFQYS